MKPKQKSWTSTVTCSACDGEGRVCCGSWAMIRTSSGPDLEFNDLGMPLWPLAHDLEMPHCPFCGQAFKPKPARRRIDGKLR